MFASSFTVVKLSLGDLFVYYWVGWVNLDRIRVVFVLQGDNADNVRHGLACIRNVIVFDLTSEFSCFFAWIERGCNVLRIFFVYNKDCLFLGLLYAEIGRLYSLHPPSALSTVSTLQPASIVPPPKKQQCVSYSLFGHYKKSTESQGENLIDINHRMFGVCELFCCKPWWLIYQSSSIHSMTGKMILFCCK
jgi:hypothetical protein